MLDPPFITKNSNHLLLRSGAAFSIGGQLRFRLWRIWNSSLGLVNWIMLNPSTADEHFDDPTIKRCITFSKTSFLFLVMIIEHDTLSKVDFAMKFNAIDKCRRQVSTSEEIILDIKAADLV